MDSSGCVVRSAECCLYKWWLPAALRPVILRLFGADIGHGVVIRHRVRVLWPWKLTVGDDCWIGEDAWILNLEPVWIGHDAYLARCVLCTGSHDMASPSFEYDNGPITIGDGVWLGAQAIILRGVTVGRGAVIAARSRAAPTYFLNQCCGRRVDEKAIELRILHLVTLMSSDGAYGGPLRVALNQAAELNRRGHEVHIAAGWRGEGAPPRSIDGVTLHLFPAMQLCKPLRFSGMVSPGLIWWLINNVDQFDLLHIHAARDLISTASLGIAWARRRPYVTQTHGMIQPDERFLVRIWMLWPCERF